VDPADNVGGGSAGDGTVVLDRLIRAGARGAVIVMCDPTAAAAAAKLGVGGTFSGPVGGCTDRAHGDPVTVSGRVAYAADTSFVNSGTYMTGVRTQMGLTAIVDVGGIRVVLTSLRTMPFDIEQLRCLGIEPADCRVIVVKSAIAWRAAYGAVARSVFTIDTPGICPSNLSRLSYRNRPSPVLPLDRDAQPSWSKKS
jgi:microcystin degradation protein MlrC